MTIQGFRVTECWYNETTISHINYWDQVNFWKKVWKFWNGSFCRNKSSRKIKLQGFRVTECCYNETAISHINYWDQVNFWKKVWKFWNGSFCRNKSSRSPYSLLQYIGRVATLKFVSRNCLRYKIDNGGKGTGLRIHVRYCFIFYFFYLFIYFLMNV